VIYGEGNTGAHEAGWLALETAKVRETLGITPQWLLVETVQRTMAWYRAHLEGAAARSLCTAEIAAYEASLENGSAA
jgi:CDP-glucose 4,6-dehydratase